MKPQHLAQVPSDALAAVLGPVEQHGSLTAEVVRLALRNALIMRQLKDGQGYAKVAKRHALSERQVRRIEEEIKEMAKVLT